MNRLMTRTSILATTVAMLSACGGGGGSSTPVTNGGQSGASVETQQTALTDMTNAIVPQVVASQQAATTLTTRVTNYCTALQGSDQAAQNTAKTAAQDAWKTASNAWQQVEMMQVNIGTLTTLAERVYSWPNSSTCLVDGEVIAFDQSNGNYTISTTNANRKGLDALEYLLFNTNADHSCSAGNQATANWNNRPASERFELRCNYAATVAAGVSTDIAQLQSDWQTNYSTQIATAGNSGNSAFGSAGEAINRVSDALFYLDTQVKDEKLAAALGIGQGNTADATKVESRWANHSMAQIKENLVAFKTVLNAGFDDLLAAANVGAVATNMTRDIDAAIARIDSFSGSLANSIENLNTANCTNSTSDNRAEEACAIHADIKKVTDTLKTDFVTALRLSIPTSAEGDND